MGYTPRYDSGDWKAICDICGREFKASRLKQRWDGLMCCQQDWEPRQPQDFVRGVPDPQVVPWIRDEPQDVFYDPIGIYDPYYWSEVLTKVMHYGPSFADTISFSETFLILKGKVFLDNLSMDSSGTITLPVYVDPTYFASDYMATSITIS